METIGECISSQLLNLVVFGLTLQEFMLPKMYGLGFCPCLLFIRDKIN